MAPRGHLVPFYICGFCVFCTFPVFQPTYPFFKNTLGTVHIVGFGLPYLGFGQCVKKVVVGHLVNSQPVVEDEQTWYTTEY